MEQFEEKYSREAVIKRLDEYPPGDLVTMSMYTQYLSNEVKQMGFIEGTPEWGIYFELKRAELFFDAELEKEAISILKSVRKMAEEQGLTSFLKQNSEKFQRYIERWWE